MNWTQEKYKVETMIDNATLTGAVITALGLSMAGVYGNNKKLSRNLIKAGEKVNELLWEMPLTDYHKKIIQPKHCDITNSSGRSQAGASQAAAFLSYFVEEGVEWAHIDFAGPAYVNGESTGYGPKILIEYAHQLANQNVS